MYTSQPCRHTTLCKVSFVLTCLLCLTALWAHPLMQGQFLGTAQCNSWVCVSWLCGFYPIFKPLSFAILFMPPYPKLLRCVHAGDRNVHNWMDMFLPLLRNNWDETFFFCLLACNTEPSFSCALESGPVPQRTCIHVGNLETQITNKLLRRDNFKPFL